MKIQLKFEPRDAWVGVFVGYDRLKSATRVYLCLVPFLPIVVTIPKRWAP